MRFEHAAADEPPASDLIAAMTAEMDDLYERAIDPAVFATAPGELGPPSGACLVGYEGERPVCVGGVRRIDARCAEIKRMYVLPDARGRGLAKVLLAALEAAARGLGYRCVRLDTGARQPHAQRLYEEAGYASIGDYNANPYAAWWGERAL